MLPHYTFCRHRCLVVVVVVVCVFGAPFLSGPGKAGVTSAFPTATASKKTMFELSHRRQHTTTAAAKLRLPKVLQAKIKDNEDDVEHGITPEKDFLLESAIGATEINSQSSSSFNWTAISRQIVLFRDMATPYYQESKQGRWLLAGLLALTLLNSGVSVAFSYLGKDFWNALSAKNVEEFSTVLQRYLGALVVGAPVVVYYRFQREQLAVHWREWMTARTIQIYTSNRIYYNLPRDIDNPDQRVAEDVNSFTSFSLQLVITLITSLIDLCSFAAILWSIYPTLFGAIIAYALAGTIITTLVGQKLVSLNFAQLQKEADLRYSLVRLRENAESIAFYAGEDLEGQAIEERLEKVMENRRDINKAQRNLEFFTTSYRYLVQILPVAVVAPRFFAGAIELGIISQSVGAFNHILSDLSIIVNQFESLSAFSAGIERLSGFFQAMREADICRDETSSLMQVANMSAANGMPAEDDARVVTQDTIRLLNWEKLTSRPANHPILSIAKLDLATPDRKRVLIRNLSIELEEGRHLLIVGNSGAGKSSLLRGIAGLWTSGEGTIIRPVDEQVYFLPQRPYCTLGTLKDQLLYPSLDYLEKEVNGDKVANGNRIVPKAHWLKQSLTDDDLLSILEQVDLIEVARRAGDGDPYKGLHMTLDWSNMLSLGEQQRLAFGRLLANQPRLVILDEATSALDMVAEARMYMLLQKMAKKTLNSSSGLSSPGLTYVSVGHRPSLLAYHDKRLRLAGDAVHELSDIEKSAVRLPKEISNL